MLKKNKKNKQTNKNTFSVTVVLNQKKVICHLTVFWIFFFLRKKKGNRPLHYMLVHILR